MGESGSSSIVVVVLFATLLVAPIVADNTANEDLPTFEALMKMNGKVNEGYTDYCCKACICTKSLPPQCRCTDQFVGGCPSECEGNCVCTRSLPPNCFCRKADEKCPVKPCLT